jgi:hypothetical protein
MAHIACQAPQSACSALRDRVELPAPPVLLGYSVSGVRPAFPVRLAHSATVARASALSALAEPLAPARDETRARPVLSERTRTLWVHGAQPCALPVLQERTDHTQEPVL